MLNPCRSPFYNGLSKFFTSWMTRIGEVWLQAIMEQCFTTLSVNTSSMSRCRRRVVFPTMLKAYQTQAQYLLSVVQPNKCIPCETISRGKAVSIVLLAFRLGKGFAHQCPIPAVRYISHRPTRNMWDHFSLSIRSSVHSYYPSRFGKSLLCQQYVLSMDTGRV